MFTLAFRHLFGYRRKKTLLFTIINLGGLAIGLAASLLITHYVRYELSYDWSFPKADNIYRMVVAREEDGEITMNSAKSHTGAGKILKNEVPEIEDGLFCPV